MIDGKFDVVFRGQVVRNMDESEVKSNLVGLFKSSPEAVEKLFSGAEVAVRKGLDYSTAMKYQSALKKAGALALIKEVEAPVAAPSSQGKASFGPAPESSEPTQSEPNQHEQQPETFKPQPQVEQSQSSRASGLPAAENPQSSNLETTAKEAQELDQDMSLAEVGAQILPDKVYEKREVDTSQLSLASAGERILPEKPPENHPQPKIDHLKLEN